MKIKSFIKQFVAAVQGDTSEVLAQKNYRKATSALEVQIAVANGELVNKEQAVETAQEDLQAAIINKGITITDGDSYVQNLLNAQNNLTIKETELKKHIAKTDFLKLTLSSLNEEVDTEEKA